MEKQYLIIHNFPALYDILNEVKFTLNLDIKKIDNKDLIMDKLNYHDLVISQDQLKISNQIKIEEMPVQIGKLIDIINLSFLKKKIEFQKNIKIGKYYINFNSRKLSKNNKNLNLTEKETTIIKFLLNSKKSVSVHDLQTKVWEYKSQTETHTVETHVYRLRKKIENVFNEKNFIISDKNGYKINTN
tara:strand:- start:2098 stop:2658 length:561 start_codon:yes stop_codon:yes gene_type:complete